MARYLVLKGFKAKLDNLASGVRLADCYQSWLISKDSYTPPEPINNSSENELGWPVEGRRSREASNQKESKIGEARRY